MQRHISVRPFGLLCATLAALCTVACHGRDSGKQPATLPSAAAVPAADKATTLSNSPSDKSPAGVRAFEKSHLRVEYPGDWTVQDDPDYVLSIAPPGTGSGDRTRRVTVDIPSLPPHLPGMITLGKVKQGYLDDLKKKLSNMQVTEDAGGNIPHSKCQRVVVTGKLNGQDRTLAAMLMIHSDRVYIIRTDSDTAQYPKLTPVWEQMLQSLKWTN
jgi:hypothetical protein